MSEISELLSEAINSIIDVKEENDIDSFLGGGQVSFLSGEIKGLDDFELICRHLLCKSSSKWIAALAAAYLDENFPIEKLDPIEMTLEDLLSEEE